MAIISFRHKFIFVKTRKTAGTSLEIHLAARCGPDDIVTEIFPPHPGHCPRNFLGGQGRAYFNHMPATLIRALQPAAFGAFFKFCFERHPVEKCLSHFAMLRNSTHHRDPRNPGTWQEYLERGEFPVDTAKYADISGGSGHGTLLVDRIYRYEELDAALEDISSKTGIAHGPLLVHEKSGFRVGVPTFDQVMAEPRERERIFHAFESSLAFTPYA